jgi:peptidoglycan hydrolase-like protein with peptidoglycan-binding domain
MQSANENQKKLTNIATERLYNPSATLGQLNPNIITPSLPIDSTHIGDVLTAQVLRHYAIGSTGDEVKTIQSRLQARKCYSGEINGTFDDATAKAVIAYRVAKHQNWPGSTLSASLTLDEGSVDWILWDELTSPLITAFCSKP